MQYAHTYYVFLMSIGDWPVATDVKITYAKRKVLLELNVHAQYTRAAFGVRVSVITD